MPALGRKTLKEIGKDLMRGSSLDEMLQLPSRWVTYALMLSCALVATGVGAETWNYQAYYGQDAQAGKAGQPSSLGYITLESSNGKSTLQLFAGSMDRCYRAPLDAAVLRTETLITITPVPAFSGCPEVRFVIKTDGSGGKREIKNGDAWVEDGLDRKLTPKSN